MDRFVSFKYSNAAYYIPYVSHIRKYMDMDTTKNLMHVFVTSRLMCTYANGLFISVKNQ